MLPIGPSAQLSPNEVSAERQELLDFYRATLAAADGEQRTWAVIMERVLDGDDKNAYYRWFVSGL